MPQPSDPALPRDPRPEFLTVGELAELLRIKERKVYDLAASGRVPCSRATGKLLFPEAEIRAWIAGQRTGPETGAVAPGRPPIFLGSHDPLLEWALRQSRCGLATYCDGSLDGLARFAAQEGVAAGVHIHDAGGDWNVARVTRECAGLDAVLITFAGRRRGLVLRPGDAGSVSGIADLKGRRIAARQKQSGTDLLFGQLLADAGLGMGDLVLTDPAHSETDAVLAVAENSADAAFGLEAVARQYGLRFVHMIDERFDLVIDRHAYFEPPIQALLAFCRSATFGDKAGALGGYDLSEHGRVRWNG